MLNRRITSCALCNKRHNVTKLAAGTKFRRQRCHSLDTVPAFDDVEKPSAKSTPRTPEVTRQGKKSTKTKWEPVQRRTRKHISTFKKMRSLETRPLDFFLAAGFVFSILMVIIAIFIKLFNT